MIPCLKQGTNKYEFHEVVKANFHGSCGYMFLITFQVFDPSDDQEKTFQARIRYTTHYPTEFVFCRPKPNPEGTKKLLFWILGFIAKA